MVQLYGNIYALGGHNGLSIFESVEVYDPATNEWVETVSGLIQSGLFGRRKGFGDLSRLPMVMG